MAVETSSSKQQQHKHEQSQRRVVGSGKTSTDYRPMYQKSMPQLPYKAFQRKNKQLTAAADSRKSSLHDLDGDGRRKTMNNFDHGDIFDVYLTLRNALLRRQKETNATTTPLPTTFVPVGTTTRFFTLRPLPRAPGNVQVQALTKNSVALEWQQVSDAQGYEVQWMPHYQPNTGQHWAPMRQVIRQQAQNVTIDRLLPKTPYSFCVAAVRGSRTGECSEHVYLSELDPQHAIKDLRVVWITHESALLAWNYDGLGGVNFSVEYRAHKEYLGAELKLISVDAYDSQPESLPFQAREHLFTSLRPFINYTFTVRAVGRGKTFWPSQVNATTSTTVPPLVEAPSDIRGISANEVSMIVKPAAEENGPIESYWIVVAPANVQLNSATLGIDFLQKQMGQNRDDVTGDPPPKLLAPYIAKVLSKEVMNDMYKTHGRLHLGTNKPGDMFRHDSFLWPHNEYKVFVRAFVKEIKDEQKRPPQGDPRVRLIPKNYADSSFSRTFRTKKSGGSTSTGGVVGGDGRVTKGSQSSTAWLIGPIIAILIILIIIAMLAIYWMKRNRKKQPAGMRHGDISKVQLGPSPNETSKLLMSDGYPPVGAAGQNLISPYEPVLTMNGGAHQHQQQMYGNIPPPGQTHQLIDPTMEMSQIGVVVPPLPVGASPYPTPPSQPLTAVPPGGVRAPIPITELAAHIERLKAQDNMLFFQEYESIETGQTFTWEASSQEVNKPKNRYANVVAYDHSRVKLTPIDQTPGSDYINANYIDGYRKQKAYIATQGPMPETFGDFWRMVWEENSVTIVMLTKLEERTRVKCDQYWPTRGSFTYGHITVTLADTLDLAHYTIRTLRIQRRGDADVRDIRHLQFTAWPDHGVPDHPTPFLMFLKRVKSLNPPEAGPIVTHCSAGIGRTGALIAIDCMLERLRFENTVDIYGCVATLRSQRSYMVQTEDQYVFIHDAVLDAIQSGSTEVPASKLYTHIQALMQIQPMDNASGMQLEFRHLAALKMSNARFTAGNLPCNKPKNRLVNILPYDSTRVCLRPQPHVAVEGTDYINASWIDGYRRSRSYIATQGPLQNTADDFWRLLWEHNSCIIVMLTKLREMGREKCFQYWPGERSQRYAAFVVEPIAEYNMPQYVLREFKMTDTQSGQSRTIRHFQFTEWPEQGSPKSGELFVEFVGQVHKTKEQFGADGPITAHCSTGVGRTGAFITLSIVLERMRYENVVDIFTTVKLLRTQRPNMVQSEDQYHFCYQAALEYLGSFDHYALHTE